MGEWVRANTDQPFSAAQMPVGGKTLREVIAAEPNPLGLPDDLREALASLGSTVACSATDFAQYYRDSWLYGIICGWGCEEGHEHDGICGGDGAMREVAARHRWSEAEVERLRRYRRAYAAALGEGSGDDG
jgi:hypothetical protein